MPTLAWAWRLAVCGMMPRLFHGVWKTRSYVWRSQKFQKFCLFLLIPFPVPDVTPFPDVPNRRPLSPHDEYGPSSENRYGNRITHSQGSKHLTTIHDDFKAGTCRAFVRHRLVYKRGSKLAAHRLDNLYDALMRDVPGIVKTDSGLLMV